MIEYELINPSDPYTFLAKTKESAALAVFLLGTMYGASPKDDNEEKRIPVFLFGGAEEWYRKEFGRSTEAGFKAEKQNVADALLSFMYGSFEDRRRYEAALNAKTSSSNSILDTTAELKGWNRSMDPGRRSSPHSILL